MSFEKTSIVKPFYIKRYSPEELLNIMTKRNYGAIKLPSRSYQITNDDQRFWLVKKVLSGELTISEVFLIIEKLGCRSF